MDESHDRTEFDAEPSRSETQPMSEFATAPIITAQVEAEVAEEGVDVFTAVKQAAREVEARKLRGTAKVVKKDELNAVIADMLAKMMRAAENEKAQAFAARDDADKAASKAAAQVGDLEEALARVQTELEERAAALREQIEKLEAIIKMDEYKSKIMELEYDLHTVREMMAALRLGIEFFGLIEEIDFDAELAKLDEIANTVAAKEILATNTESFAKIRDRLQFITASIKEDKKLFASLKDAVEAGKGSVSVVFDLSLVSWRCSGMMNEAEIIKNSMQLIR